MSTTLETAPLSPKEAAHLRGLKLRADRLFIRAYKGRMNRRDEADLSKILKEIDQLEARQA